VRAIMEGITFELRRTLEIVEETGSPAREVYTIGGGARSDLWSQIKADIYKRPVYTFEDSEGGILGSAILAGAGVGAYASVQDGAQQCLRVKRAFEPDPATTKRYDYLYEVFREVHDRLQGPFDRIARMP
jgi:xylulokinase